MIKRNIYGKTEILTKDRLKLSHVLFLVFWLLKPFYVFSSGSIQPSDAIFFLSFFVWILENRGVINIDKGNQYFVYFVVMVFFVNIIYSLFYRNFEFIEKSIFYLYGLFIVICFQDLASNNNFLKKMFSISVLSIALQMVIYVFNLGGRYYFNIRYMGTFNDPNQLSFFLFSSFLLLYVILYYFNKELLQSAKSGMYFLFAIVLFLIFQGSSTGALLGVLAFVAALMLSFVTRDRSPMRTIIKLIFFGLAVLGIVVVFMFFISPEMFKWDGKDGSFLIQRVFEKIEKVTSQGLYAIIEERQLTRVFLFPRNLIYGAGEGLYDRFLQSEPLEIHSTLIALWFYYGLIPMAFLFIWIKKKVNGLPKLLYPVYFGLLFESLILANQRQPVLWMLFILADISALAKNPNKHYGLSKTI